MLWFMYSRVLQRTFLIGQIFSDHVTIERLLAHLPRRQSLIPLFLNKLARYGGWVKIAQG